jgi:hypothetical protein
MIIPAEVKMKSIESVESSSPVVTRAVASGLRREFSNNLEFPFWQKILLTGLGTLPQAVGRFVISRFQSISGLSPALLDDFKIDELLQARLNDYAQLSGSYPTITIGVALGGATSYLSLALNAPFLPQAFVVTIKGGSKYGNVDEYLHRSLNPALRIADENSGLVTIQHFDPVHDGWLTRYVNHLRFKLLDLPPAYAEFIKSRLNPGGAVVYLEGGASWLRYRLGLRSFFQVGGWGGIPASEFLESSQALQKYALRSGLKFTNWKLKDYPLEEGPESEWGSEPGMAEVLENFCHSEGYRFIRINLPHPNDFSRLAFNSAIKLLEKEGREPAGVLVEMFGQFDATSAFLTGLLPLWLIFNTHDSLEYLKKMSKHFPAGKPVFFSPLATFSLTPDMVPFQQWKDTLDNFHWINIGTRPSHYPSDVRALLNWNGPLRAWVKENYQPLQSHLNAEEISRLAEDIKAG